MPQQKFAIIPFDKGQETRVKPWLIPNEAFAYLQNCYVWRDTLKKRFGSTVLNESVDISVQPLFTRLRVSIGTTDVTTGNFSGTAPGVFPITQAGEAFSIGSTLFTVTSSTPGAQTMLTTGLATGTFNVTNGAVVITGNTENPLTLVYYYPATPVMHFGNYSVTAINESLTFAWDTKFAYQFTYATGWDRIVGGAGNNTWTGSDSDFFWTTNWRGPADSDFVLFVTNNTIPDAMRYWDGTNWNAFGSAATTPITVGGVGPITTYIVTCLTIEPFANRLLLFNTTENDGGAMGGTNSTFRNRIRFSKLGSPVAANSWRTDTRGLGGFIEADTNEAITSVRFIKNRCIVFFEQSVYELVSTGSNSLPFIFQRLNSELGVESTNSTIPFDQVALGFGSRGLHSCNGINVERIDDIIPQTIFQVSNSNAGPQRVTGIRDYYAEMAYWSYPSIIGDTGFNETYPTQVLVYNDVDDTWATNDDSITAFGYYQITQDLVWSAVEDTWENLDIPWDDPSTQNLFQKVIAGNQEGFTFLIQSGESQVAKNSMSLQITNITFVGTTVTLTIQNHNLEEESYIYFQNIVDTGTIGTLLNGKIFQIDDTTSSNTITIIVPTVPTGTYRGGGVVTRASQIDILTKQYNFFYGSADNIAINEIAFYVDKTTNGEIMVDYYIASSEYGQIKGAQDAGSLVGTSVLETSPYDLVPLEQTQNRFWHRLYPNFYGENIQLRIYLNNPQMLDVDIAFSDFQLNGMIFTAVPISNIGG